MQAGGRRFDPVRLHQALARNSGLPVSTAAGDGGSSRKIKVRTIRVLAVRSRKLDIVNRGKRMTEALRASLFVRSLPRERADGSKRMISSLAIHVVAVLEVLLRAGHDLPGTKRL